MCVGGSKALFARNTRNQNVILARAGIELLFFCTSSRSRAMTDRVYGWYFPMSRHYAESYPYIRSIVHTLNSVARLGSFANGGAFQLPLPALKINGVDGFVGLPANIAQAKAIISVCSQAPYGRGEETSSVRPNTWQLDPAQFTIMNPEWDSGITNLADVVERELGCDPSLDFHYELYKFLLYEQGSFFKVHVDLEFIQF